jgi:phospholipase A-2-activating protein
VQKLIFLGAGGSCIQSIEHPGCVWDVTFLPNGDLVTACSDGVARVWTRDSQHSASLEELEAYKSLILTRKMQTKTVGGVKVDNLPGLEALQQPGAKDGQTRIVREGDSGVAYSWNAKEYKWDKIGEVVDGPGDNLDKKSLNGVTYDYVFDVDIGDGLPTRKLPYNHGQNPYDVADQWLANEELPAGYREQVVQFILQNTGSTAAPPQFDPAFVDPYTGGKSLSIISASISYTICNPMVAVALLEELDTLMSITAK